MPRRQSVPIRTVAADVTKIVQKVQVEKTLRLKTLSSIVFKKCSFEKCSAFLELHAFVVISFDVVFLTSVFIVIALIAFFIANCRVSCFPLFTRFCRRSLSYCFEDLRIGCCIGTNRLSAKTYFHIQ